MDNHSSVGACGWLGFVLLNFAACGIIVLSTAIGWYIGFGVVSVFAFVLLLIAYRLHLYEKKYYYLENLLWVLGCTFVFVSGVYISVNVVCPWRYSFSPRGHGQMKSQVEQIEEVLVSHHINRPTLIAWAKLDHGPYVDHINFAGLNFFNGFTSEYETSELLCSNTNMTSKVDPGLVLQSGFIPLSQDIFFLASEVAVKPLESNSRGLYKMNIEGAQKRRAELVKIVENAFIGDLVFDASKLYFKASYICSGVTVSSVFQSDGTAAGTFDLYGPNPCDSIPDQPNHNNDRRWFGSFDPAPRMTLWSIIGLGDVPMIILASLILYTKRSPGVVVNLYYGVAVAIIVIYLDAETNEERFASFLKWFITLYTAAALVAIAYISVLADRLPIMLELLRDWVLVFAGIPFFFIVHIDFDIPATKVWWKWLAYCCIAAFHLLLSVVVRRSLPTVMGSFCAFVLAWHFSVEIEGSIFNHEEANIKSITILALLALQGVCIIVGAIFYTSKRAEIEDLIRSSLRRQVGRRLSMLVQSEVELSA